MVRKTRCYPKCTPIMTTTFYNWTVLPPTIFTGMYECFSIVFFNSVGSGSDVLQRRQPHSPLATPFTGSSTMRFLSLGGFVNPLNAELNPICYFLALLGAHHFLHVSRIRVKSLTLRLLMSYIYGAPILDVSRSHTTTHHSR